MPTTTTTTTTTTFNLWNTLEVWQATVWKNPLSFGSNVENFRVQKFMKLVDKNVAKFWTTLASFELLKKRMPKLFMYYYYVWYVCIYIYIYIQSIPISWVEKCVVHTSSSCSSRPDGLQEIGSINSFTPHTNLTTKEKLLFIRISDVDKRFSHVKLVPCHIQMVQVPSSLVAHYTSQPSLDCPWTCSTFQPALSIQM